MIPPSGTFDYVAEFTEKSFSDSDIILPGADQSARGGKRLVGLRPRIRFWNDRLVIVASDPATSKLRNVSFGIGDVIKFAARPGDQLYLTRTGRGGIGLSVLRHHQLVLAIGAITAVPLGTELQVQAKPLWEDLQGDFATDTWLEFGIANKSQTLRNRETLELEGYFIYVERCWKDGEPGTDECVSICEADDLKLRISAMRSAILLANSDLKMVNWDGSEQFTRV